MKELFDRLRTYELAALAILTLDVERPQELIILKILIFLVIAAIIVLGVYALDKFLKRKKKKDERIV